MPSQPDTKVHWIMSYYCLVVRESINCKRDIVQYISLFDMPHIMI